MLFAFIILIFFVLVLFVGYKTTSNNNISDFIFSGRKLTIPSLVATLVTTWYGGINEIGIETINNGIVVWLYFGIFYYISAIIYAYIIAPKIISNNYSSIPLTIFKTYGKLPGLISLLFIFLYLLPSSYLLILGQILSEAFDLTINKSILIGLFLSSIYTLKGGFNSIVNTDKIQFLFMFLGFTILSLTLFTSNDYGIKYLQISYQNNENLFSIPGNVQWTYIFMFFFLSLLTFLDPSFYQRTYSGKNLKTVQNSIIISIIFWIIFDFMTITSALFYYGISIENQLNPLQSNSPYIELAKIVFADNNLFLAIFFISIISVVMSTIDSYTFLCSVTLRYDLGKILGYDVEIKSLRQTIIIVMIISYLMSTIFNRALDYWYYFGTYAFVSTFIPLICALFKIKLNNIILIMVTSITLTISWDILSYLSLVKLPSIYIGFLVSCSFLFIQKLHILINGNNENL